MVGMTLVWVVVGRMNLKKALQRTKDVARAAQILESLLALGHIPTTALKLASEECPVIEPAVASVHMGGDPWEVMEHLARVPGQAGLSAIGQAWRVSHVSGSSMHEGLERVRKNLEEAASTADVVAGELAGPRATGQLLAVLPLIGIAMAYGLGADPIQFFTSSVMGRACFIVGLGLGCLGVIWSEILAIQVSGLGGSRKKE
jgi:tight adherence protein B